MDYSLGETIIFVQAAKKRQESLCVTISHYGSPRPDSPPSRSHSHFRLTMQPNRPLGCVPHSRSGVQNSRGPECG